MLTLKYAKKDTAKFISHIDLLRQFIKILNRAEVNVSYSGGFSPHMNLFFSPALPLGVDSEVEYCTIDSNEIGVIDRLKDKSIRGLEFIEEFKTDFNPKLASKIVRADYMIDCSLSDDGILELENFLANKSISMQVEKKGEKTVKDIKPLIYGYNISTNLITFNLAIGNPNLRIDQLIKLINLNTKCNLMITNSRKTEQYVLNYDKLINVDKYLKLGV